MILDMSILALLHGIICSHMCQGCEWLQKEPIFASPRCTSAQQQRVIQCPAWPFSEIRQGEANDVVSLHNATIRGAAFDVMRPVLRAVGRGSARGL